MRWLILTLLLASCAYPPEVTASSPRAVMTRHNPGSTSEAEIGQIAEQQCQQYGKHAQPVSSRNVGTFVAFVEITWDCVD